MILWNKKVKMKNKYPNVYKKNVVIFQGIWKRK